MPATVTLMPFNRGFECRDGESILEAALRNGIELRYGCRHGGCGTCKALVAAGEVDDANASLFALSDADRELRYSLMCSAYPLGDVTIELEDYDAAELFGAPANPGDREGRE